MPSKTATVRTNAPKTIQDEPLLVRDNPSAVLVSIRIAVPHRTNSGIDPRFGKQEKKTGGFHASQTLHETRLYPDVRPIQALGLRWQL